MLPLTLTVRNFLCYSEDAPVLDLRNVRLACLSGQNGHGKSALLDAMTWALWGKARGKTQEEMVHQGAAEMRVELEFRVRGQQYRVIRRYRAKGSRTASLASMELAAWDGGRYVAAGGDGVRGTEEKVQALVGMDYNTFVNSAFLLQGHSDAFTAAPPRERKEVLARILELDFYDRVAERARREASRLGAESLALERDVERLTAEAGREADVLARTAPAATALAEHRRALAEATTRLEAERRRAEDLRRARDEARQIEEGLPAMARALADLTAQRDATARRVAAHREAVARRAEVLEGCAWLGEARRQLARLEAQRDEHQALVAKRAPLEQAIAEARAALEQEGRGLRARVDRELQPVADGLPALERDLSAAQAGMEAAQAQERKLAERRAELERQVHEKSEALARLREREDACARAAKALADLQAQTAPLERAVAEARARLEAERDAAVRRVADLEPVARALPQRRTEAQAALKAMLDLEATQRGALEARTAKAQALRMAAEHADAEAQTQAQALKELADRLAVLGGTRGHPHAAGTVCPLCESPLGEEGIARLRTRFEEEATGRRARKREVETEARRARADLAALEKDAAAFEAAQERERTSARRAADAARKAADEAALAVEDARTAREQAAALSERIERGEYAEQEHKRLLALQARAGQVRYDPSEHQSAREGLTQAQRALEPLQAALARDLPRQEQALARQARDAATRLQGLRHEVEAARRAADELAVVGERLAVLRLAFQLSDYAHESRAALRQLDDSIAALGYDASGHDAARRDAERYAPFEAEAAQLARAEADLPGDEESLRRLDSLAAGQTAQERAARERRDALQEQARDLPAAEMASRQIGTEAAGMEDSVRQGERLLASLEAELDRAREAGKQAEEGRKRLADAREEQSLYDDLARAFGRNGVQLMVIQRVLPEIEEEANLLLSRMTDGRMNVRVQLERRGAEEQLAILIADELGTRAYEMFSGGEAFRVDLALRIALARVLTRRSGAPLSTLFIDEGFGTQDSAGLEGVVDVLRSIRDDFEQVIVVTHLESLKDQFPVRIDVVKRDSGSTFSMTWNE